MTRLKYERIRGGLSQYALGLAAHIDQSDLAKMELGRYIPGRDLLDRLAAVLQVPADALLNTVVLGKPRSRDAAGRYMRTR